METTEKITKTTQQLIEFERYSRIHVTEQRNSGNENHSSKIELAVFLVKKSYEDQVKNLNQDLELKLMRARHYLATEDKVTKTVDTKNLQYTKEAAITLNEKIAELNNQYNESTVEVTTEILPTEVFERLSPLEKHVFEGFFSPEKSK